MNFIKTYCNNSMHTKYEFIIADCELQKLILTKRQEELFSLMLKNDSLISDKLFGLSILARSIENSLI